MWTTIKIALLAAGITVTALMNASTAAACDAPQPAAETSSAHSPAAIVESESECLAAE